MSSSDHSDLLNRRNFMRLAAGAFATGSIPLLASCDRYADGPLAVRGPSFAMGDADPITRYPLRFPPAVTPNGLTLNAAPTTIDIGGGTPVGVWGYNGVMPGPTVVARRGDVARILLQNGLPERHVTHWHGVVVNTANDGGPQLTFPAGGTYSYEFPILQRAGLNFYHSHAHHLTGKQVYKGLAGGFVVRDEEEDALGLPSGKYELPLVLRLACISESGTLEYNPMHMGGGMGGGGMGGGGMDGGMHDCANDFPLINGVRDPYHEVDAAVYRLRLVNGDTSTMFRLTLGDGAPFTIIGNDGGLLERAVTLTYADIAPGERLDVLVDFSRLNVGDRIMLHGESRGGMHGGSFDLVEFRVAQQGGFVYTPPRVLSRIERLSRKDVMRTRNFAFGMWNDINGYTYDMDRIDFEVPFGQTELWRFSASHGGPHPVHVHGTAFQVVARSGGRNRVMPWEQGLKDTVVIQNGETVDVLVRFTGSDGNAPYCGRYVMHCHRLEHEDAGMMMNFVVV